MRWSLVIYSERENTLAYLIYIEVEYSDYIPLCLDVPDRQAQLKTCCLAAARQALFHGLLTSPLTVTPSATGNNVLGLGYGSGQDGMLVSEMASTQFWFRMCRNHERELQRYVRLSTLGFLEPKRLSGASYATVALEVRVTKPILDNEINALIKDKQVSSRTTGQSEQILRVTDKGVAALNMLDGEHKELVSPRQPGQSVTTPSEEPGGASHADAKLLEQPPLDSVFVVRGRDDMAASELEKLLVAMGLRLFTWEDARKATNQTTPPTLDIVEKGIEHAHAVVVLLTPDESAELYPQYLRPDDPPGKAGHFPNSQPEACQGAFERSLGQARVSGSFGTSW